MSKGSLVGETPSNREGSKKIGERENPGHPTSQTLVSDP